MPSGNSRRQRRAALAPKPPKPVAKPSEAGPGPDTDAETAKPHRFAQPHDVDGLTAMLGADRDVSRLIPKMENIPWDFKAPNTTNPFVALQRRWFFEGVKTSEFTAKPGIDRGKALRHLGAIQRSFEPSCEHKEAAVAFLMSLWFEEPTP